MIGRLTYSISLCLAGIVVSSQAATPRVHEYAELSHDDDDFPGYLGFGDSVALNGDAVFVGERSGRVGLRRFDRVTGEEDVPIVRALGLYEPRLSFSFDGNVVAVGAADSDFGLGNGSVRFIDLETREEFRRIFPDGFFNQSPSFGSSVAFGDGVVLVGDDGGHIFGYDGAAYLFDSTSGEQLLKLTIEESLGTGGNYFGAAVAIEGNVAWIGASGDRVDGRPGAGSIRLFDIASGEQLRTLTTNGPWDEYFGRSLDIDDGVAVVGASGGDGMVRDTGAAYLLDASTGSQIAKLTPSDGVSRGNFGREVAIDGGLVLVGAPFDSENGDFSGAAYLFDAATGSELAKLMPSQPMEDQGFGWSVAIDDGYAVIGAGGGPFSIGSAYLFDLTRFIPEPSSALLTATACLVACRRRLPRGEDRLRPAVS